MLPDEITFSKARELVTVPEWVRKVRRMVGRVDVEGADEDPDHWMEGDGYTGNTPAQRDPNQSMYMERLKSKFVTEDLASDVLERRTDGVLGRAPTWSFETDGDERLPDEEARRAAVQSWLDEQGSVMRDFAEALTYDGPACLRFRVVGRRDDDGETDAPREVDAQTPEEALDYIHLELARRDEATVHTDRSEKTEAGVFIAQGEQADDDDEAEICYIDDEGNTRLSIRHQEKRRADYNFGDLSGHLLIHEASGHLLMTSSLRSNQKGLNTKRTWMEIIDEKAGFPELHLVGVEAPRGEDGGKVKPDRGPGKMMYHVKTPSEYEQDGETIKTSGGASVKQFGGSDNESLRRDCDEARHTIYRTAKQLHVFLAEDGQASGRSRILARSEFVKDLDGLKTTIDRAGSWMLETLWALAESLSGRPSSGIGASWEAVLNPGPLTAKERKAMRADVESGAMSLETYLRKRGVSDPEAEVARIKSELEDPLTKGQVELARVAEAVEQDRRSRERSEGARSREEAIRTNGAGTA